LITNLCKYCKLLEVNFCTFKPDCLTLHKYNIEGVNYAFVDYYEDYYKLEAVLLTWLRDRYADHKNITIA